MLSSLRVRLFGAVVGASALVSSLAIAPAGAVQPVPYAPGYFNGVNDQVVATLSGSAYGLAYDGHGNFYVGSGTNIDRVSSAGASVSTFVSNVGTNDVTCLAIDANGDLWAGGFTSSTLHVYAPNGSVLRTITTSATDCSGITFDDLGHVYFTDYNDAEIFKMNLDGTHQKVIVSSGLYSPWGLAYNHHGQLIIGDGSNSRVASVNLDGSNLSTVFNLPGGGFAGSVQVLSSGQIVAGAYSSGKIFIINPSGQLIATYTSATTSSHVGAALFDAATQKIYYTQTADKSLRAMRLSPYAQSAGPNAATVTWIAPAFHVAPVLSYTVTAVAWDESMPLSVVVPASSTTATIYGLASGVAYRFEVFGTNTYGDGDYSSFSNPVLVGSTPPSAPTRPTASALNDAARVSWSAPSNGGSPITAYFVSAYDVSAGGYALVSRQSVSGTTTSAVVGSLSEGDSYVFEVTALNAQGYSTSSPDSATLIAIGVPTWDSTTPPVATALSKSARVSWSATVSPSFAITGFTVTASPGGKTCSTTGARNCVVKGLVAGKSYHFNVVAKDAAGSSSASVNSNTVKVKS